jgi:hypothetical protein
MIIPFCSEDLFEINKDYEIVSFENNVLVIDNWYKNYEKIYEILQNIAVPNWKKHENSRNFIDYFDCRASIPLHFPTHKTEKSINVYLELLNRFFNRKTVTLATLHQEFNYFKNINTNVSNKLQHFPHTEDYLNCLIYFDKICSGGTALYNIESLDSSSEELNIFHDVSDYDMYLIKSKPNRLVIFDGKRYHGGYIENHNEYVEDWRINQAIFFH